MKRFKFYKDKVKTLSMGLFISSIIFSGTVFAQDVEFSANLSDDYKEWTNNKEEGIMPKTYSTNLPEEILKEYIYEPLPSLKEGFLLKALNLEEVSSVEDETRYNLAENIPIRIKHQGTTTECWAFSLISCMESNFAIKNNASNLENIPDFSERHMDYATSKDFSDGINEIGYNRSVGKGGIPIMGLSYLSNGTGAVLEQDMPFEDNENQILLSSIDKKADTTITGYKSLTGIFKEFDRNGHVKYTNGSGHYYTEEEVKALRKIIKENIVKNGAVTGMTAGNHVNYYNNPSEVYKSTAYFCNNPSIARDHAITIVGWDDNYSKENFNENCRPNSDGAYIILNSYGENMFDKGYMYVSYEDVLIESDLYVIEGTEKVNYDKIYQNDFFGGIYSIGSTSDDTGYYANVYSRDLSKNEYLTDVGISVADYVDVEIYLNPSSNSTVLSSLVKVGESSNTLEPGYHKIKITPTKLTGNDFAIVVKQKSKNGIFYFSIETAVPNTVFENVESSENSYYSLDGQSWNKINNLSIAGINMKDADVCIKAFTKFEEEIEEDKFYSSVYQIDETTIMKIAHKTRIEDFLNNIVTNLEVKIYSEDGNEVTDQNEIMKSGMKVKLSNGKELTAVVRGDLNGDGLLDLVDLSRITLHYVGSDLCILEGAYLKGADLNYDGKINLIDMSQLIVTYVNL